MTDTERFIKSCEKTIKISLSNIALSQSCNGVGCTEDVWLEKGYYCHVGDYSKAYCSDDCLKVNTDYARFGIVKNTNTEDMNAILQLKAIERSKFTKNLFN